MRGKRVLITGAAGGIGRHLVRKFLDAGASVIPADMVPVDAARLRRFGDVPACGTYDVGSPWSVKRFAERAGRIDILVNNAGIPCSMEMADMSVGDWERLVVVNLMGPVYHMAAYLPGMIERGTGRIVNVSSGQAFFRLPTWGAYSATKAALGAISELLDFEVRKHGVRVTTVYPFMVDTPFYKGVEAATSAGRLSMKLLPFYSDKPEKVARKVFEAVRDGKRIEFVNPINAVGMVIRAVPPLAYAVTWAAERLLAKRKR